MFNNLRYFSAVIVLAGAAFFTIPVAQAVVINSGTISPGFSKDNQNADGTSDLGAGIELNLSFTKNDDTTGQWSATINNTGQGVVTLFALSLNEVYGWTETGFSYNAVTTDCLADGSKACSWSTSDAGVVKPDILSNITLGAAADSSAPHRGIDENEIMELIWDVSGDFSTITGSTTFAELVAPNLVNGETVDFNSFWAAHVQVLANGASDKIGGSILVDVPEPGALALLGIGLIAVAVATRRRRNAL